MFVPTSLAVLTAFATGQVWARDYFDPSMLTQVGGDAGNVDLSQFETQGAVPEGTYLVDVFVNNASVSTEKITFKKNKKGDVVPQLTPAMLARYGVNLSALKVEKNAENTPLEAVSDLVPSGSAKFSVSQQRLDLSIPQLYVSGRGDGYVDPSLWDQGIPVMLFNYNLNGSKTWNQGTDMSDSSQSQNLFASANGGVNVGPWRLRTNWSYSDSQNTWSQSKYSSRMSQFSSTYLQRNVASLRSELSMGELSSGGDIFDSIPFRGVQMMSDDSMMPSGQRGFAPVVTGVAKSNALVTITQNGNVIYQTNVAPGPFRIDDLTQAGTAGDLVVTVTEADGSKHTSTQAYSSLPVMQRPGNYQYEVSTGRYRNGGYTSGSENPVFVMGTLVYGLPHYVTLYGGVLGANNYQSVALGTGVSLGFFGALSFDATTAKAILPGDNGDARGSSFRMKYSKSMLSTGSTVDLTSYRYSTRNFYTFTDVNSQGYSLRDDVGPWNNGRKRSSWQLGLSQTIGNLGSIYLRGTRDDYWGISGAQNTLNAGFSSSVRGISYSVNYSIDRQMGNGNWPVNRQISFNMSVPLSLLTAAKSAQGVYVNYNINHSNNDGHTTQQISGGGTLADNLSWGVSEGWGNRGDGQSGALSLAYTGDNVNSGFGYNYGRNTRGVNGNMSGGVLLHRHGLVLSRPMGDTMALVSVPGVEGVAVGSGGKTNSSGYALVPYMTMYQKNTVSLDPTTLPDNAEVVQNSLNLYPTRGAVVEAKFTPRIGRQVLMALRFNGKPVPFGAVVTLEGDNGNSSIVGDDGVVYLSGLPEQGRLKALWGGDAARQCTVSYALPPVALARADNDATGMLQVDKECQ